MSIQQLINGISLGSVYALIAVGFALIFNVLKFSNFSHGGVMTVTAYSGYLAAIALKGKISSTPLLIITIIAAAIAGGFVAVIVERTAFRRLRINKSPVIYYFVSSITMGMLLENLVTIFASSNFYSYPFEFGSQILHMGKFTIAVSDLFMLIISAVCLLVLMWVLYKTRIGIAIRALSFDVNTSTLMGIDTNFIIMATFFTSGVLGGISGVFLGINYTLYPQLGKLIVKGFIASVIGGLGNISGAVIGAVLLGIIEVLLIGLVGSGMTPVFTFVIMLVFLLLRPQGIAGKIVQEKA